MSNDSSSPSVNPGYAFGQLHRALATSLQHADPQVRARAAAKLERWRAVLDGMAAGLLSVGSEAGKGTTFHVFLPAADSPDLSAVNGPGATAAPA